MRISTVRLKAAQMWRKIRHSTHVQGRTVSQQEGWQQPATHCSVGISETMRAAATPRQKKWRKCMGIEEVAETAIVDQSGAECGALSPENASIDPVLQAIIERWPSLSDEVKASIVAMAAGLDT
jgi:hypothetical protein